MKPFVRNTFRKKDEKYRVNELIKADSLRVIDEEGKPLGVLNRRDALNLAKEKGLDLIEVAPKANPPTCKIMDYGKWKYENKKKLTAQRKKQNLILVKEIQIRIRTDQHDLDVKKRHATRFLEDGNKVKVNLRFSGREFAYKKKGIEALEKFYESLKELCLIETEAKIFGRGAYMVLAPDKKKTKKS